MITILHLVSGLRRGGAEGALARLVMALDRREFRPVVASLTSGGVWADTLRGAGVEVRALGLDDALGVMSAYRGVRRLIGELRPRIVQSWLYHADLLAALALPRRGGPKLIWTLRNSDLSGSGRPSWRMATAALARLSRKPDLVISNSRSGLEAHLRLGYRPRRTMIIPNGVDTDYFRPGLGREAARRYLQLPDDAPLIGMAARYDVFKDHLTFLKAAALMPASVRFVLAGAGIADNRALARRARALGVLDRLHVLGDLADPRPLYAALDVATLSSSHGEGFPNAIAEAMACAAPVAATDVGDVREIVGEFGLIAPPRAPQALAAAWSRLLEKTPPEREALAAAGRDRIEKTFALSACVSAYQQAFRTVSEAADRA